ncbi:conserved hypothetical protein [Bradyrhizobium sp. ORS 278]|uniref:hypothetical protein n=1 Tax=Bradyrhizobium sp. (strain ORS 278) TaxID=114615 RepID=UPI0001507B66|nr:hypothetical protein [Bradyrhizobium sp. ORS 278]CAL75406.1 conserved hypothetical protein [Bradyrhizobium sp. ORS 278]
MLSQSRATPAARAARPTPSYPVLPSAIALLAALSLAGCQPRTIALAGADPADPAAHVAPVRTSAVVTPYTPLRPTTPAAWGPRSEPSR